MSFRLVPITIREANRYVARWHRHSRPVRVWVAATTFRKDGTPILGSLGASADDVAVMTLDDFKRLCALPGNATTQFEIGDMR